jgi:citrate synthase
LIIQINMKNSSGLYLSAREASAELAISPATLYAYVSRGLIRSEPSPDSRSRRYRAEDVRALKERRAPSPEPKGFRSFDAELPVMDSAIATITEGGPIYRGVNCVELAEKDTSEHAATLLWDVTAIDPFASDNCPIVSDEMRAIADVARRASPIERSIAVLALAAGADPGAYTRARDGRALVGGRIVRLVVATMLNATPSAEPLHQQIASVWAGDHKHAPDLIRRALVLLADHELNASTFTVRCAASTELNLYDALIAGLAALKGPKHGGAGVLASQLVRYLIDRDVAPVIRERVALGERFAGFGHGVYRNGDPRAISLLEALTRAGAPRKFTREVPERIAEATGEFVNIDYALAVLVHALRLPAGSELALFAMARSVGWIAHACEQLQHGRLIRPRARYVGPSPGRGGLTESL